MSGVKKNAHSQALELQRLQHRHEFRMSLLAWLREDEEIKYLAIIAGATCTGALAQLLSGEELTEEEEAGYLDQLLTGLDRAAEIALPWYGVVREAGKLDPTAAAAGYHGVRNVETILVKAKGMAEGHGRALRASVRGLRVPATLPSASALFAHAYRYTFRGI